MLKTRNRIQRQRDASPQRANVHDSAFSPRAKIATAKMAVITCIFNFSNFKRPRYNLLRFLRQMDQQGIPVFGIELVRPGQQSLMGSNPNWRILQGTDNCIMWQKEALLNECAHHVPSNIQYIAALDSDVSFMNPRWMEESVEALKSHPVIQPFARAVWTNEVGIPDLARHSCAKDGLDDSWNGHPGFAWAMRRDFFEAGGFYPYALLGAGDTVTACGLLGKLRFGTSQAAVGNSNIENGVYETWRKGMSDYMDGQTLGHVDGDLWHEWHGNRAKRKYSERSKIIEKMDVLRDVRKNTLGFMEWTPSADHKMRLEIWKYFAGRDEDGTTN